MIRHDQRTKLLAAGLSALAGFVDATGFIQLGGFYVAFMSGNSTRLAVGLVRNVANGILAAELIGGFVLGVMLGTLVGRAARKHRPAYVLGLVAILLALAALLAQLGFVPYAIAAMVLAMGAENVVFERDGEVHIGLTYMTGALVKLGHRLAGALLGGDRWAWWPHLMLWLGLMCGALAGALAYPLLGLANLWLAALAAAAFALLARRIIPDASQGARE
jgi:uncharacterized membrane protein YoaK (UPF0700 family)